VKNFDLFDGALRVFALAPYLLMIIPAAVIILGIIIVVKGKNTERASNRWVVIMSAAKDLV
jgi:hypothetical protein